MAVTLMAFTVLQFGAAASVDPAKIINIGQQVWQIVQDSKILDGNNTPGVDINGTRATASAVPEGLANWTSMEGWTPSKATRYSFKMHDPLHIPFLQYDYSLSFLHGGSLDGVGHYLAEVRLVPEKIWLNFGAGKLNAEVEIRNVVNAGSKSDPVAGMEVVHRFTQKNFFQENVHTEVYFIKGTGEVICQSGPACDEQQDANALLHV
jgi:hypothetical protein